MFDRGFTFRKIGVFKGANKTKVIKYRFRTHKNQTYIVDIEQYEEQVYIIKYYLKAHSLSDKKYSLRTNEYIASRIYRTCMDIVKDILKQNPKASFGYVGANDLGEDKDNTKRYRIYKKITETFFGSERFEHFSSNENSLYLILNKQNKNIDKTKIIKTISENFDVIF